MTSGLTVPKEWTFDSTNVADNFDAHVREQLPWYDLLTRAVAHIGLHYIPVGGSIYDVGASTGNIGRALRETIVARQAKLTAIDNSPKMAEKYDLDLGELVVADACTFDFQPFDLCVCFLSLMFVEPSKRPDLIAKLRKNIKTGGALLIIDKCEPSGGYFSVAMSRLALAEKLNSGVDPAEIIAKELSLSGVQRPISLKSMAEATEFFRFGDFAGWIFEGEE